MNLKFPGYAKVIKWLLSRMTLARMLSLRASENVALPLSIMKKSTFGLAPNDRKK